MNRAALVLIVTLSSFPILALSRPGAPINFRLTFYAAPNGSATNNGLTPATPWSLGFALSQSGSNNSIILLPGIYPNIEIGRSGTKLVSQTKWGARVVGSPGVHGIWTDNNVGSVIIDGIEVASSGADGIKLNGPNCVVRNCWVHDSFGSGISARLETSTILEQNLLEGNGTGSGGGHGIAMSGTNCTVRGNVIRYNYGFACQVYEGASYSSAECAFYNNLMYGNAAGVTIWSPSSQTNYFFNNTTISTTNECLRADYGNLYITNNILIAGPGQTVITMADGATVWSDYNLVNATASPAGQHDVVTSSPLFVNANAGLFWLATGSPAVGAANPGVVPPLDFFGKLESSVSDVGAVQYNSSMAADSRSLDPSTTTGADYWAPVSGGGLVAPSISAQPQNQTVTVGQSVTFSVAAAGGAPLSYQWTFNGTNVNSTSSAYTRSNCQLADNGGIVRVTVSNGGGSVQSTPARIIVNPSGTNYYVATSGSSANSGLSTNSAWSLSYALSMAGPSNIITLLPGVYPSIAISRSGITLKSQIKWGAKIVGTAGNHGIWTSGNGSVSNVVIDGFEISHAYMDGVKLNGPGSTVRNCWIHNSGQGDPNWAINSNYTFSGQGVHSELNNNVVVEYNLIENNGAWVDHDHGMYLSGTNLVVRGNVVRYNVGAGLQFYSSGSGATANAYCYDNLIYCNGTHGPFSDSVVVYAYNTTYTNYFYGNTIVSTNRYAFLAELGNACLSNNILTSLMSDGPIETPSNPSSLAADYNLLSNSSKWTGRHDLISSYFGFANPATGLYWLRSDSPAIGKAASNIYGVVDFFGNYQSTVSDIGAFQYSSLLSSDSRVLDPSPSNPDYWSSPF